MKKFFLRILSLLVVLCFILPDHAIYAANTTCALSDDEITISNNVDAKDCIYITGVLAGDVVRVYNAATGGKILCQGTVPVNGSDIRLYVAQLGISEGSVYISVTSRGMAESSRTKADYLAESISDKPLQGNIKITNNVGKADTIYVCGLAPGDTVKIYNKEVGGAFFGSAVVPNNTTEVTKAFSQLGANGGTLYISVKSRGMLESDRVKVDYPGENQSSTLLASNIKIANNAGKADTISVSGLAPGDMIKVYNKASGGSLLGTAKVALNSTSAIASFNQLGANGGTVYISLTSDGMRESPRISVDFPAESQSTSILEGNVIITNNIGKADTIYIKGLSPLDKVKVYDRQSGGNLIVTGTVLASESSVTMSVRQLGSDGGNLYISATSVGMIESPRTCINFAGENRSNSILGSNVTIINSHGKPDTIYVKGLLPKDKVNVYNQKTGGSLIGTGTVAADGSSLTISIPQLGKEKGTAYISVISTGLLESPRVGVDYDGEAQSELIDSSNIVVANNAGKDDIIQVNGVSAGEIIKVYDADISGNLLGSATVSQYDSSVTIKVPQLGIEAGEVYVSRTSPNKIESDRSEAKYAKEGQSNTIDGKKVSVTNNAGIADTVKVTGLAPNDVVKVYDSSVGGNLLGSATASSYGGDAVVSVNQLGSGDGNIYVTVTSTDKLESDRTQVGFKAEAKANAPTKDNVVVMNNSGIASEVIVDGLNGGDIVNVYDAADGGNLVGTGTVEKYNTEVIVPVSELKVEGGSVYISTTSVGKLESDRQEVDYGKKLASNAPNAKNVIVKNNADIAGAVTVKGVQPNDVIKIYDSAENGNLLATGTVASDSRTATILLTQLNTDGGQIYISVTSTGKQESARTQVVYNAESKSDAVVKDDVTIVNNSGEPDTIEVTGLAANDIVNVYSSDTTDDLLGTATVASGASSAVISISQLGAKEGSVWISVKRYGKTQSDRIKMDYASESTAPLKGNISVVNNVGLYDTVTVNGLTANDIVNVYDAQKNGTLLASACVVGTDTSVTISIPQLGTSAGKVYVSVTNSGKGESSRTEAAYLAEQNSTAPFEGNVKIVNNTSGTPDTITVNNVDASSIVKVYDASTGGNLIGQITIPANSTSATITVNQLGVSAGSVYISVTSPGKNESSRTKAEYTAEK